MRAKPMRNRSRTKAQPTSNSNHRAGRTDGRACAQSAPSAAAGLCTPADIDCTSRSRCFPPGCSAPRCTSDEGARRSDGRLCVLHSRGPVTRQSGSVKAEGGRLVLALSGPSSTVSNPPKLSHGTCHPPEHAPAEPIGGDTSEWPEQRFVSNIHKLPATTGVC